MAENSKRFLDAFGKIEHYLRTKLPTGRHLAFYQLVEDVGRVDAAVRQFGRDLKEYADLRNAIIHERSDGRVIAEPNDVAVVDLEKISSLLRKPPTVYPLFGTNVITLADDQSIASAVKIMFDSSISQVPILRAGKFHALLTTEAIARWLGASILQDILSLKETSIARTLEFRENCDNYRFLGRQATLFEAIDSFSRYESRGSKLDAILITEHGRAEERILGIVTVADLPKALKAVDRR